MAGRQLTPLESALTELRAAVAQVTPSATAARSRGAAQGSRRDHSAA